MLDHPLRVPRQESTYAPYAPLRSRHDRHMHEENMHTSHARIHSQRFPLDPGGHVALPAGSEEGSAVQPRGPAPHTRGRPASHSPMPGRPIGYPVLSSPDPGGLVPLRLPAGWSKRVAPSWRTHVPHLILAGTSPRTAQGRSRSGTTGPPRMGRSLCIPEAITLVLLKGVQAPRGRLQGCVLLQR